MKQSTRREAVNEYAGEGQWLGFGGRLMLVLKWLLGPLGLAYGAVMRPLGLLGLTGVPAPERRNSRTDIQPRLVLTLEKVSGAINLAVANPSDIRIWAEEATVDLDQLETDSQTATPTVQASLKIRRFVAPSETLHVSLVGAVYDAAGRPKGAYSCLVSTVLRFRTDQGDQEQFEQSLPPYRARMISLVPISLRRTGWFDKPTRSPGSAEAPAPESKEHGIRVRRSQRLIKHSAVVVTGQFNDGRPFEDSTRALVLSAHGCLVTLTKPVRIGESFILRNISTLQELLCQVVYIGEVNGGGIQVGLGFETAAPEFWGTDELPSTGRQWHDRSEVPPEQESQSDASDSLQREKTT